MMTGGRRRIWLAGALAAAITAAAVAAGITLAVNPDDPPASCRSALIPAYLPANELARVAERPAAGRIVVVNPANGPGEAAQPAFRKAVAAVRRSGARVLGYVHTAYGERPQGDVEADVRRYREWYGVDGIFLDEAARTRDRLPYYRALRDAVRTDGDLLLALNPGVVPDRGYFDIADVVVTFEGPYAEYEAAMRRTPAWVRDLPAGKVAHLVHAATRAQAEAVVAREPGARYVYATSGVMPDPWSALPAYLDDEETLLARCAAR
jgi:hypothetical protein